jgi:endoribonuclease Dicer
MLSFWHHEIIIVFIVCLFILHIFLEIILVDSNISILLLNVYPSELQGFIRNEPFDPKTWIIPGAKPKSFKLEEFVCKGRKFYTRPNRKLRRKVVADVVEALIGAFLSAGGETAALLFMDWIGIKVNFNITPYERQFNACPENIVNVVFLESLLKYSFRDRSLLVEALTHGSYMLPDVPRCYQVLTVVIIIILHVEARY